MDYDRSFKIIARESGTGLALLAGIRVDGWTPTTDTVQTAERLADRAFRATQDGEAFVVYFEAQTEWVESLPWSVLSKSGLLSERERMPTKSVVFVLTPRGYQDQQGTFRLAVGGEATQQVWFKEVRLWEERPQPWWENNPGLMALLPLCAHEGDTAEAVARAAGAIRARSLDATRRETLLTTLAVFARLMDEELDIFSIIAREEMRENTLIQEFIEEGRQEGAAVIRTCIHTALQSRFGDAVADELDAPLTGVSDLGRLRDILQKAITEKLEDVRRDLTPAG